MAAPVFVMLIRDSEPPNPVVTAHGTGAPAGCGSATAPPPWCAIAPRLASQPGAVAAPDTGPATVAFSASNTVRPTPTPRPRTPIRTPSVARTRGPTLPGSVTATGAPTSAT